MQLCIQDTFEKVNKAYEFLCTKSGRIVDGPDPENIILILKAQSILFNHHKQGASAKPRAIPQMYIVFFFNVHLFFSLYYNLQHTVAPAR